MFAKTDVPIVDGATSNPYRFSSDSSAMLQVACAAGVITILEGQLMSDPTQAPVSGDWIEFQRVTGPGIFAVNFLPTFFRLKASGGTITSHRVQGYNDANKKAGR